MIAQAIPVDQYPQLRTGSPEGFETLRDFQSTPGIAFSRGRAASDHPTCLAGGWHAAIYGRQPGPDSSGHDHAQFDQHHELVEQSCLLVTLRPKSVESVGNKDADADNYKKCCNHFKHWLSTRSPK
ncbi:MAG: hypothetical protein ABI561_01890 [Bradyrhizobium sp.]